RQRFTGCVLAAVLFASCGGKSAPPPPQSSGPAPGTVIQITGTERLGWTQSATDMSGLHFAAYVDGNARSELSGAACTAGQEGAYTCESPLPPLSNGTHSLELVAWLEVNGEVLESVRSPALTLQVIKGAAASTA